MNATITVEKDPRLLELFAPEDKKMPRGSYTITQTDDKTVFDIEADDPVALRALLNAITKLLTVWHKTADL